MGLRRSLSKQDFGFPPLAKIVVYTETEDCVKRHGACSSLRNETGLQAEELNFHPHLHQMAKRCGVPWEKCFLPGRQICARAQLCPATERKRQVTANEIKALFTWVLTWTFWISSGWRCYQLPLWQLCRTPVLNHICLTHLPAVHLPRVHPYTFLTAITSSPQDLLLTPHRILSVSPAKRGKPAWKAVQRAVPRKATSHTAMNSQPWSAWEARRQWLIAKWSFTGSMGGGSPSLCDLGVSLKYQLRSSYRVYGKDWMKSWRNEAPFPRKSWWAVAHPAIPIRSPTSMS